MGKDKILIFIGVVVMSLGVLITWLAFEKGMHGHLVARVILGWLGLGALAILVGSVMFSMRAQPGRVMLIGAVAIGMMFGLVPLEMHSAGLTASNQGWMGALYVPVLVGDVVGLILFLVGFSRFVFRRFVRR